MKKHLHNLIFQKIKVKTISFWNYANAKQFSAQSVESVVTALFFHSVSECSILSLFFFNSHIAGGVEMSPLGTSATGWPIVLVPGDCDHGKFGEMKIDRGNRSTRRKPAPAPLSPPQIPLARPGLEPGPARWEASD
jgi:hypothetical protein